MLRPALAVALLLASAAPLSAATQAEVDGWLATSPEIVRTTEQSPAGKPSTFVRVRGAQSGGFVLPEIAQRGYLANDQEVMIVPLPSGGSGGVFTTLLFTTYQGRRQFVGYVPSRGGHLSIMLEEGNLLIRTPIYGPGDPNCCPSTLHYERATLKGIKLVTLEQWDEHLAPNRR